MRKVVAQLGPRAIPALTENQPARFISFGTLRPEQRLFAGELRPLEPHMSNIVILNPHPVVTAKIAKSSSPSAGAEIVDLPRINMRSLWEFWAKDCIATGRAPLKNDARGKADENCD